MIEFNPQIISFWKLLEVWFDLGTPFHRRTKTQYKSAIYYTNLNQQDEALSFLEHAVVKASKNNKNKRRRLYVDVTLVSTFYQAESYHQDYVLRRKIQSNQTDCLSKICTPVWKTNGG